MDFVEINNKTIIPTELAITPLEQEIGLMFRNNLPPSMSFVYNYPRINKFWMKQTPQPLDIIFVFGGKVISIFEGKPYSTEIIGNDELSDLIVELPKGHAKKYNIKIGDLIKINFSKDSLTKFFKFSIKN